MRNTAWVGTSFCLDLAWVCLIPSWYPFWQQQSLKKTNLYLPMQDPKLIPRVETTNTQSRASHWGSFEMQWGGGVLLFLRKGRGNCIEMNHKIGSGTVQICSHILTCITLQALSKTTKRKLAWFTSLRGVYPHKVTWLNSYYLQGLMKAFS